MKKIKLMAVFAALLVGIGVYQFLKELSKPQEVPRTPVVVAAVDIPENTQITADMVCLQPIAIEALLPNHLLDVDSVIGRVLSSDVYAGEQIVRNRLISMGDADDSSDTLAYVVQPGMRAITVAVNTITGLENMIRPGNRVDILTTLAYQVEMESEQNEEQMNPDDWDWTGETENFPPEKEEPETVTITQSQYLLQNVEVLAVSSVLGKDGATEYASVTLHVTPEDALKIQYADSGNEVRSLRLVVRSPLDEETTAENTVVGFGDIVEGLEE